MEIMMITLSINQKDKYLIIILQQILPLLPSMSKQPHANQRDGSGFNCQFKLRSQLKVYMGLFQLISGQRVQMAQLLIHEDIYKRTQRDLQVNRNCKRYSKMRSQNIRLVKDLKFENTLMSDDVEKLRFKLKIHKFDYIGQEKILLYIEEQIKKLKEQNSMLTDFGFSFSQEHNTKISQRQKYVQEIYIKHQRQYSKLVNLSKMIENLERQIEQLLKQILENQFVLKWHTMMMEKMETYFNESNGETLEILQDKLQMTVTDIQRVKGELNSISQRKNALLKTLNMN